MELVDASKDLLFVLAGGGILWKLIAEIIVRLRGRKEGSQTVTVNTGNTTNAGNTTNSNGNGRIYATKEELSKHALNCAGAIHEKINQNYQNLSNQMNYNHKETMKVFADMRVDITKLQSMRSH